MSEDTQHLKTKFSRQMQEFAAERKLDDLQPLQMLLDDGLPVRITLHPNHRYWIIEVSVYDAMNLQGPLRQLLIRTLLKINGVALEGQQIICTLNRSEIVVLTTRWPAEDGESHEFLQWLNYTIEQARHIREIANAASMELV